MKLFTVSLMGSSESLVEKLYNTMNDELHRLHKVKDKVKLDCQVQSTSSNITCTAVFPIFQLKLHGDSLYDKMSIALANFIVREQEAQIIRNIIARDFKYGDPEEAAVIEKYCMQILQTDNAADSAKAVERRKLKIANEVKVYLQENIFLNIDGFICFRLHSYMDVLREIVEYAVDEYLMDKQYQEFISLLKYFVYIQDAKIPIAHLMHKGDNEFVLLNEQLEPIETKQMEGLVVEMVDKEINYEDMIVSTLITVSPQKVYIHTRDPEAQVIKTIQQIFEERADLCTYCGSCRPILGETTKKGKLYP